jgi:hypothetical protein
MAKTNYSPTFPMFPGGALAVTPSDSALLAAPSVIFVGGAGNVRVTTTQGDDVVFFGLQSGGVIPVQVIKVWATNTTATNLVRVY